MSRALSNVADEGLLQEGFFWIPSLAGPTTLALQKSVRLRVPLTSQLLDNASLKPTALCEIPRPSNDKCNITAATAVAADAYKRIGNE